MPQLRAHHPTRGIKPNSSIKHKTLTNKLPLLGYASLGLLGLAGIAFLFPVAGSDTNATETNTSTIYKEMSTSVNIAPVLSVALNNSNIDIDVIPTADGTFESRSTTLSVSTNNNTGYNIYLSTNGTSNELVSIDTNNQSTIAPVENAKAGTAFTPNTWGYTIAETANPTAISEQSIFSPVPTSLNTAIATTPQAPQTGTDTYQLGFGTKIGTNLASGRYTNSVVVSVVTNPQEVSSLLDLVYIQDMTTEICNKTAWANNNKNSSLYLNPVTKQLTDIRDGKKYWVAKLADGNCWMTQNLALDLAVDPKTGNTVATRTNSNGETVATTTLGVGNTNLESLVSPTNQFGFWQQDLTEEEQASTKLVKQTETEIPEVDKNSEAIQNKQMRSWNLGEIVLNNPTTSKLCPQATPPENGDYTPDASTSAFTGQNIFENCNEWYTDVSGYTATNTNWNETKSVDVSTKTYNAHYLLGNYYQWGTATAGSGIDIIAPEDGSTNPDKLEQAMASICPKGWQLPTSGSYYNGKTGNEAITWPYEQEKSLMNLLVAYGYPTSKTGTNLIQPTGWHMNGTPLPYASIVGTGKTQMDYSPIYFVRNGYLNIRNGSLYAAGDYGYYWSNTAYPDSSVYTYSFNFNTANVLPAARGSRFGGFSIRCIAQ